MTARGGRRAGLLVALALAGLPGGTGGNGDTQREVQGRVVAVDGQAGTLMVERAFRGKTSRLSLRAAADLTVYACSGGPATLDRVKTGAVVSVFYEVLGSEGVANLVVLEPAR